jgi:hypothetical protein
MKAKLAQKNSKSEDNHASQEIDVISGRLEASPKAMNFFIQIVNGNILQI